ncbi:hypothetical protein NL676_018818 [Syzygium grande]|nr:hypothetical protein NL676_018818 [Syzygium grande]
MSRNPARSPLSSSPFPSGNETADRTSPRARARKKTGEDSPKAQQRPSTGARARRQMIRIGRANGEQHARDNGRWFAGRERESLPEEMAESSRRRSGDGEESSGGF